jgi:hypothetical protein
METISLSSSPAQLIAADAADDAGDEGEPVRFHAENANDDDDDDDPEPEPEQLSPEEKEERRQLIRKVGRYRLLFPKEISDINVSNLDALPLQKLRDLSKDVEFLVATRRSAKACRSLFIGSLVGLEAMAPYAGMDLKGLSNVAASSEDLLLTVDECAVRYEQAIEIDPLARLAIGVAQLALAVDSHNKRQRDNPPAAPVVTAAPAPTQAAPADAGKRADNINAAEFQDL